MRRQTLFVVTFYFYKRDTLYNFWMIYGWVFDEKLKKMRTNLCLCRCRVNTHIQQKNILEKCILTYLNKNLTYDWIPWNFVIREELLLKKCIANCQIIFYLNVFNLSIKNNIKYLFRVESAFLKIFYNVVTRKTLS